MNVVTFLTRARRALRRPPRYLAGRSWEAVKRRAQRPIDAVLPRMVTTRMLLKAAAFPDVDSLWGALAQQPFFLAPRQRDEWARRFRAEFPTAVDAIVASAERALRHEFDLLGSGTMALGDRLPWHADFKTGRVWPRQYCADIEYYDLDRPTDVKVPWELSRCQHFTRLGQAYWLTGDERYAREFAAQVTDWIGANPYAWSVNWICAMDVALRAVSWMWGFFFMADADACASRDFRSAFLRSLFLHGEFIASHRERSDVNDNHYLCDGVGLVFLGCFFARTARGRAWRDLGRDIVTSEIFDQVTPDGVDFEQSTAYHRLVLECFSTSFMLLERNGERIPPGARERLMRMFEYVAAYTKPGGSAPLVGDADDGRIQILGTQPLNDHRYLLSTAAAIGASPVFKSAAGSFWDESFWLLGPDGLDTFARLRCDQSSARSTAFPDGGVYVLRSANAHVVIDCGDVGMRGRGGHGHNDILSFELFLNGFNVVTDCGAYLYTASREWRNRFRSTAFHNTLAVDDEELNRFVSPDQLWRLQYDAVPEAAELHSGDHVDRFRGAHCGYRRLPSPVTHRREFFLSRNEPRLLIADHVVASDEHRYVWRFHLDPSVVATRRDADVHLTDGRREAWLLNDDVASTFTLAFEDGWVSPSYGVRHPTTVLTWRTSTSGPFIASFLFAESRLLGAARAEAMAQLVNS